MPLLLLPFDNLYKYLFLFGISLVVLVFFPVDSLLKLKDENTTLRAEKEIMEKEKEQLSNDIQQGENKQNQIRNLIDKKNIEMEVFLPGTKEYDEHLEKFHYEDIDPDIGILFMDISNLKDKAEEINHEVQQLKAEFEDIKKIVVKNKRELEIAEICLITKELELSTNAFYLKNQLCWAIAFAVVGFFLTIFGGYFWYHRTQKYQDLILKSQALD